MSKGFTVTRNDHASMSVTTGDALHTFRRPQLEEWVAFVDLVSEHKLGTAALGLVRSIYGGPKPALDRLVREFPALPQTVASEIAELLIGEAKKGKR